VSFGISQAISGHEYLVTGRSLLLFRLMRESKPDSSDRNA
jgi:hypothetical protein